MRHIYWDASALAKRFVGELGAESAKRIFDHFPSAQMSLLSIGIGEVISIAVRKRNAGLLTNDELGSIIVTFQHDVLGAGGIRIEEMELGLIERSLPLIIRHNLNATDAVILRSAMELSARLSTSGDQLALIPADVRLLRAAATEGLTVFNPETGTEALLSALIA